MTHTEFLAAKAALYEEYKNSTSASAGGGVITVISSIPNPDIQRYYAPLDVVKLNNKYHFPFNTAYDYPKTLRNVLQLNSTNKASLYVYHAYGELTESIAKTSLNYSNFGNHSFVPVINTKG